MTCALAFEVSHALAVTCALAFEVLDALAVGYRITMKPPHHATICNCMPSGLFNTSSDRPG